MFPLISDNQFKDKDAPFLCKILEENTKLRELNLSNNEFGTESGILFGEALGKQKHKDVQLVIKP